jgi:hypothetical protein
VLRSPLDSSINFGDRDVQGDLYERGSLDVCALRRSAGISRQVDFERA